MTDDNSRGVVCRRGAMSGVDEQHGAMECAERSVAAACASVGDKRAREEVAEEAAQDGAQAAEAAPASAADASIPSLLQEDAAASPAASPLGLGPSSAPVPAPVGCGWRWNRTVGNEEDAECVKRAREDYAKRLDLKKRPGVAKADMQVIKDLKIKDLQPVWGHVPGVPIGACFSGRGEMAALNVHTLMMKGIDSRVGAPVTCIVIAGGYRDDNDTGDVVFYTGEGGQDSQRQQVADQTLTKGNKGLAENHRLQCPVRVVRGVTTAGKISQYVYEGLYEVASYCRKPSGEAAATAAATADDPKAKAAAKADGPLVFSFELRRLETHSKAPEAAISFRFEGLARSGAHHRHRTAAYRNSAVDAQGRRVTSKAAMAAAQSAAAIAAAEHMRLHVVRRRPGLLTPDLSGGVENVIIPVFNETGDGADLSTFAPPGTFLYVRDCATNLSEAAEAAVLAAPPVKKDEGDEEGRAKLAMSVYSMEEPAVLIETVPGGIIENRATDPCSAGVRLPLEVFRTADGKGWGVRCPVAIENGSFVAEYGGETISSSEIAARGALMGVKSDYIFNLDHFSRTPDDDVTAFQGLAVDAYASGSVARFINHCAEDKASLCIQPVLARAKNTDKHCFYRVALFAQRDIPAFEELLYCYGPDFFEPGEGADFLAAEKVNAAEAQRALAARDAQTAADAVLADQQEADATADAAADAAAEPAAPPGMEEEETAAVDAPPGGDEEMAAVVEP